ncbi:MAG: hypothetical protein PWR20_1594 [Bacteroidales bacterium]|jgi:AcrR family transcriptional regulator|nr:hypothetical protein [Bacteroidales bacterium]
MIEPEDKLKNILDRCLGLFYQYGIRSLSMDDIAQRLGISKKTLYHFFSNKDDLVRQVIGYLSQRHREKYDAIISGPGNAIDKLLKASMMACDEMRYYNPVMTFDLQKYHADIVEGHLKTEKAYFREKIRENLIQGIEEGLYRPELNVELVATLYVSNLAQLHRLDEVLAQTITFRDIFQVMFENYIRGISTTKGISYYENEIGKIMNKN